jgi:catechol 2,3-dioxygenase-like lactoylglutathione lyase family enzyme
MPDANVESLSAVTLATGDMRRAIEFYALLGFELKYGSPDGDFASFRVGDLRLNLALRPGYVEGTPWGRLVFWVDDVDEMYAQMLSAGLRPEAPPRDAEWGERYFHLADPDGHELSFARPLNR